MTELSDELLVAYVDGQLARKQTRAVEKVLAHDDVSARRVEALKEAHARLEEAFETILASEVRELTSYAGRMVEPTPRGNGRTDMVAALLGIGLGAVAALYVLPQVYPDISIFGLNPKVSTSTTLTWQDAAARAHALLSRAGLEAGLESEADPGLIAFRLAKAIGPAIKLPDLQADGLSFVRAQLLQHEDKSLAQILYLPATGAPLALFAVADEGTKQQPQLGREGAVGMVSWSEGDVAYLLAGKQDDALLLRLAEKIRREPPPAVPRPL